MRAFVDESGTPSIKDRDTKPYFVVGCVLVEDPALLESLVRIFRSERGWSPYREIKFRDSSPAVRRDFLQSFIKAQVIACGLVVPKVAIVEDYASIKPSLYHRGIAICLDHALSDRVCRRVTIDNYFNTRAANRQFRSYLRQTINQPTHRVTEFAIADSAKSDCLQVADMVAGAIAHAYAEEDTTYAAMLRSTLELHTWPEDANDLQAPRMPVGNSEGS
jgi:hypothetical protein